MSTFLQPPVNARPAPIAGAGGVKVSIESAGPQPVPCSVSKNLPEPGNVNDFKGLAYDLPESQPMMFSTLGLPAPLVQATRAASLNEPTPIQGKAIPVILQGNDLIGNAPSGSGKTGAFLLPMFARLIDGPP
jgi:hypothetical protein